MGPRDLEFNLSNTKGLVVCAISRDQVGVDVEPRARGTSVVPIADTVFSQDELAALRALPESEQPRRAIELWTLKESFIKARGLGLSLPLDRFTMLLDADRISIRIDPSIAIPGERWQFALFSPPRSTWSRSPWSGGHVRKTSRSPCGRSYARLRGVDARTPGSPENINQLEL